VFDFTVLARDGRWLLQDDMAGELGCYDTRAEALAAASEWMRVIDAPWPVLIFDETGEWEEVVVEPTVFH
jgi:hypothetical protein